MKKVMQIDKTEVEQYWQLFCQESGVDPEANHMEKIFADPSEDGVDEIIDGLVAQVISGKKGGTSPCKLHYEKNNMPIPLAGDYWIIVNSKGKPAAITVIEKVEECPFDEVDEEWAMREGEADGSHEYWWGIHRWWFRKIYRKWSVEWNEQIPVLLIYFKRVHPA